MRNILIFLLSALSFLSANAQEKFFMTGLRPDNGTYDKLPRKVELVTRDYMLLPNQYSLFQYCPEAKSQSSYGTCSTWATVYAARTIAEAVRQGWTEKDKITEEAFSPLYVYAQIKDENDVECQNGSFISEALDLLKDKGAPKFSSFDVLCASNASPDLMNVANQYKIDDYFTLFSISFTDASEKIRKVKKAISEDCPVVIAMHLPESFQRAGKSWDGSDVDPSQHGYHAMCAIAYDDALNGGSFQIMNSWGTYWGDKGFVWVKYSDFAKYVDQAYEIYVNKTPTPVPTPEPDQNPEPDKDQVNYNQFAGEIELQLSTGEKMVPVLDSKNGMQCYRIADEYISRTRYRIYISNNEPAYVYVIGSDLGNNVSKVFPPTDNISAALTYKSNHIAIPDETYFVEMDDTKGTDFMCVLYSRDALDINAIVDKIEVTEGSFYDKLKAAISEEMAPSEDITYDKNAIKFSAKTEKTLVPLIVELSHK